MGDKLRISRRFINLDWSDSGNCLRAQDIPLDASGDIRYYIFQNRTKINDLSSSFISHTGDFNTFVDFFNNDFFPKNLMLSGTTHLTGDIIPEFDNYTTLGSPLRHFKDLYVSGYSLNNRINYLSSLILINQQNITQNASDINDLESDIQNLSSEVDNNSNDISNLDNRVTNLENQIDDYIPLTGTQDISGNLIPKINEQFNLGSNSYRFYDLFISYYGSVKDTISGMKSDITNLQNNNSNSSANISDLQNRVTILENEVDSLSSEISATNSRVDTNSADILYLSGRIDANSGAISGLQNQININASNIAINTTNILTNSANIQTLSSDNLSIHSTLNNFDIRISGNTQNIQSNYQLITANTQNINDLSTDVFINSSNILQNSADIQSLQTSHSGYYLCDGTRLISGNIIPYADNLYSIGTSTNTFYDLYLRDGTIGSVVNYLQMLYNLPRYELTAYKQILDNANNEYSGNYLKFSEDFNILTGNHPSNSAETIVRVEINGNNFAKAADIQDGDLINLSDKSIFVILSSNIIKSTINLNSESIGLLNFGGNSDNLKSRLYLPTESSGRIFQNIFDDDFYTNTELRDLRNETIIDLPTSSNIALNYVDAGQVFVNESTSGTIYTLPVLSSNEFLGLKYQFANLLSTNLKINVASSDYIQVGNINSVSGGYIETSANGAFLKLIAVKAGTSGKWLGIPEYESWVISG